MLLPRRGLSRSRKHGGTLCDSPSQVTVFATPQQCPLG